MNPLLLEAVCLYWPVLTTLLLAFIFRPNRAQRLGLLYAVLWNLATLPIVNGIAMALDCWTFETSSPRLGGLPLSLWLGWAALWGGIFGLLASRLSIVALLISALVLDFVSMPLLPPLLHLNRNWLLGEGLLLAGALLPSLFLCQWTGRQCRLGPRTVLIATGFALLTLVLLPLAAHGGSWVQLLAAWEQRATLTQALAILLAIALALPPLLAVRAFVVHGRGTPVPMDAPVHLVTSGIYARIRNPMQFGITSLLALESLLLESFPLAAATLALLTYSLGFAKWSEEADMQKRFGTAWDDYRRKVPAWRLLWRKPK